MKTTGRPRNAENADQIDYWTTPLYAFIFERFPQFVENNRITVRLMAEAMGMSTYRIYCVFRENRLSPKTARKLIIISENHPEGKVVTREDLTPFLLN
jgi:hypothetical protein